MKFSKYLKMKLKKPKFWDYRKPNFLSNILFPISLAINFLSKVKIRPSKNFKDIKCICVGNIYLGGTGKTSLAIELKKILDKENINSCFIKKEYSDQEDEQLLLNNFGKTFINKSRVKALENAISEKYQVAIFDDGLQDKNIRYDLSIVCFNSFVFAGNELRLPSGPLRESINNLKKYDAVFITGRLKNKEFLNKIKNINPNIRIFNGEYESTNFYRYKKHKYLTFSGIGNPIGFISTLKKYGIKYKSNIIYPDHYDYSDNEIKDIKKIAKEKNLKILTTEKDFNRIPNKLKKNINFIKINLKIKKFKEFKKFIFKYL